MKNNQSLPFVMALLSLVLLLGGGCKKPEYIQTVRLTPYLGLPAGLNQLVNLNVARLRTKDFIVQLRGEMKRQSRYNDQVRQLEEQLGFNLFDDFDQVSVGQRGAAPTTGNPLANMVAVARGRFADPGPKLEKFRQYLGEEFLIAPPPFTESTNSDTGVRTYSLQAHSQYDETMVVDLYFGFPADDLMVFGFSKPLFTETLQVIGGLAEGLRTDQEWLTRLSRPTVGALLWAIGTVSPAERREVAELLPGGAGTIGSVQEYFFNLDLTERFETQIGLLCNGSEQAGALQAEIKTNLESMKQMLSPFTPVMPETTVLPGKAAVLLEGPIVKILLSLSEQETRALTLEWRRLSEQAQKGALPLVPGSGGITLP